MFLVFYHHKEKRINIRKSFISPKVKNNQNHTKEIPKVFKTFLNSENTTNAPHSRVCSQSVFINF